ncbi:MAG: hypothetical protein EPN25_04025 [Nitrospirae bacterium]|nr:MAG: hypothetical protein EPN25_04025 [Nitrospirota bacterium]
MFCITYSKKVFISSLAGLFIISVFLAEAPAAARAKLWPRMCASCHDGETALSKEALREKYPTVEVFTAAVMDKGARCMNILRNDRKLIKKIANEIGIKDSEEK